MCARSRERAIQVDSRTVSRGPSQAHSHPAGEAAVVAGGLFPAAIDQGAAPWGGIDFPGSFGYPVELRSRYFQLIGIRMVKLTVRERESIQEAVRRFRKLVERSGIKKEMRRREFFEKPSETRRRARLRAERRTKRNRLLGV